MQYHVIVQCLIFIRFWTEWNDYIEHIKLYCGDANAILDEMPLDTKKKINIRRERVSLFFITIFLYLVFQNTFFSTLVVLFYILTCLFFFNI